MESVQSFICKYVFVLALLACHETILQGRQLRPMTQEVGQTIPSNDNPAGAKNHFLPTPRAAFYLSWPRAIVLERAVRLQTTMNLLKNKVLLLVRLFEMQSQAGRPPHVVRLGFCFNGFCLRGLLAIINYARSSCVVMYS